MTYAKPRCSHLDRIREVDAASEGCASCMESSDTWVHLRMCMECGHVGCCDSSKNQHASRHFGSTGHPIVQSKQPGESWYWCFEDEVFFDLD